MGITAEKIARPDDAALVLTTLDGGIIDTSDRVQAGDLRRAREAYEQITKG